MGLFQKKQTKHMAPTKISSGEFEVCVKTHKPSFASTGHLKHRGILAIFLIAFIFHTYAFFERHLMKGVFTPIILIATGFVYDTVFAAQPPAPAKSPSAVSPSSASPGTPASASPASVKKEDPFDPLSLDEGRIKILLSLYEREQDLKKWEESLNSRETMAKALEVQVEKKSIDLGELKKIIEALAKSHNDAMSKNMKNLVIVYESMKPQVAAKFFDELPLEVLMGLVQSMNPKKTSAIFSSMNTEKVKSITDKIALMPRIPER